MKLVSKNKSKTINIIETCIAVDYPDGDKDIWGAVIRLNGRYPLKGYTVNEKCKELVYFLKGSGKLVLENKIISVKKGDQLVIEPGEKFYWEGKMEMFMPCAPAWYPEQHKVVE